MIQLNYKNDEIIERRSMKTYEETIDVLKKKGLLENVKIYGVNEYNGKIVVTIAPEHNDDEVHFDSCMLYVDDSNEPRFFSLGELIGTPIIR